VRLAALRPGDPVSLRDDGHALVVVDGAGLAVAALSGSAAARWRPLLSRVRSARVRAVEERVAPQSAAAYRSALRTERWRVPLVDLEWEAP
jgi:ATP-dependent DNA helicase RecQ